MSNLLNRLVKLEQSRKSKTTPKRIIIVKGDESIPLEQLQRQWMVENNLRILPTNADWIHICLVGAE